MRRTIGLTALALAITAPAWAQSDLLNQGRGLLDQLNKPGSGSSASSLSTGEIASGLKEALRVGTERVVGKVGKADGFNANPEIHVPLPDSLKRVQSALHAVSASGMADDLELRLNRAAEAAAPQAKTIFWKAISDMSVDDARGILNGPQDSATQYLKGKMSAPLETAMKPVVDKSLADAGAIKAYDGMMGQYKSLPFMPDVKANLTEHVLDKALDGIFLYLGREEAAIRQNPAQRSTDLLKKVFGAS
jgi:hypothetical protein